MPVPPPRAAPTFCPQRIRDEAPLPRRRRDQRSLREPGPGKRSPWSREAGERAARRRVDDVAADDVPRTARSGSRAGSQVTGSAASRVMCGVPRLEGAQLLLAECSESGVVRSTRAALLGASGVLPDANRLSVSRRAAPW